MPPMNSAARSAFTDWEGYKPRATRDHAYAWVTLWRFRVVSSDSPSRLFPEAEPKSSPTRAGPLIAPTLLIARSGGGQGEKMRQPATVEPGETTRRPAGDPARRHIVGPRPDRGLRTGAMAHPYLGPAPSPRRLPRDLLS